MYFGCAFAGQATHADAATRPGSVEYVPASQSRQVAASVAPTVAECLPAAQSTQTLAVAQPAVVAYFPATQLMQKKLSESPVSVEYLPQLVHAPLPATVLNFPAAHAAHGATAPVKPGGRTQAVSAVCRVLVVTCPFGHCVQLVEEEAAEYVFKAQSVHVVDPCSENVPTGQAVHTIVST